MDRGNIIRGIKVGLVICVPVWMLIVKVIIVFVWG